MSIRRHGKGEEGINGTVPMSVLHPYNSEELENETLRQFKMVKT